MPVFVSLHTKRSKSKPYPPGWGCPAQATRHWQERCPESSCQFRRFMGLWIIWAVNRKRKYTSTHANTQIWLASQILAKYVNQRCNKQLTWINLILLWCYHEKSWSSFSYVSLSGSNYSSITTFTACPLWWNKTPLCLSSILCKDRRGLCSHLLGSPGVLHAFLSHSTLQASLHSVLSSAEPAVPCCALHTPCMTQGACACLRAQLWVVSVERA